LADAETVASVAQLYLGNILYAIELASMSLEQQGKADDASYYRAIGRTLAEAHGREKRATDALSAQRATEQLP
jgi:hypothetical protein